jgi:hypothetical protein
LRNTASDEDRDTPGQTTDERRGREQGKAADENSLRAEAVAEGAGCQQQTREDQRVGVNDPLQAGYIGLKRCLDPLLLDG